MARSFFQDFTREDGSPITVEYEVQGSYTPATYSPANGAVGGDVPEFSIIRSWPNTEEYDGLHRRLQKLLYPLGYESHPRLRVHMSDEEQEELADTDAAIARLDAEAALTDAERERMEAWIAEHHVEPDEEPEF